MTSEEFLSYNTSQVRYNETLLEGYVALYKEVFGKEPNCISCTFNDDFQKLRNHFKQEQMPKNKDIKQTFKIHPEHHFEIIRVNGIAMYIRNASDDDIREYLKEGVGVDIEARKRFFTKLPDEAPQEKEPNNLEDLKVADLRKLAQDKGVSGYANMKKEELIESLK